MPPKSSLVELDSSPHINTNLTRVLVPTVQGPLSVADGLRIRVYIPRIDHLLDTQQFRIRRGTIVQVMGLRSRQARVYVVQVGRKRRAGHCTCDCCIQPIDEGQTGGGYGEPVLPV